MSEYDLLAAWFRVADWAAYDLAKEGAEGIVLKPLGRHSKAATFLARSAFSSSNYQHRKLAARLAGWVQQPPLDLLAHLFQHETERDRRMPKDDFGRLETQSVVEDIVFSAAFWARREHSRPAAVQLLRDVVERTLAGEYWNSASYAMTTLFRHQVPGYSELLTRFLEFASSAKVNHPSCHSLRRGNSHRISWRRTRRRCRPLSHCWTSMRRRRAPTWRKTAAPQSMSCCRQPSCSRDQPPNKRAGALEVVHPDHLAGRPRAQRREHLQLDRLADELDVPVREEDVRAA
jgi:hypothetical protein